MGVEFLVCYPRQPLIEAAAKAGIRPIMCRQERVGVAIADGFSRTTNGKRLGVFSMQQGPGTENSFPGAAQAYSDNVPLLMIPGGEALAERTANGRLGILGGLSILGTTGIVMPYSCAAWIHSIHRGIDVARAAGLDHVGAATGRTSEAALQRLYGLPDHAMIDMGDFAGAVLKYLRRNPLPRLSIAGGFGKLSKLAAGHLDLHSGRSRVDTAGLAELLADLGASAELVAAARDAASAGEVLERAGTAGRGLAEAVARRAREVALAALSGDITVEVLVFARNGELLGRAGAP